MAAWQTGRTGVGVKPITLVAFPRPSKRLAPDARIPWWPGAESSTDKAGYTTAPDPLPSSAILHLAGGVHIRLLGQGI
jgi:hypothetical protein